MIDAVFGGFSIVVDEIPTLPNSSSEAIRGSRMRGIGGWDRRIGSPRLKSRLRFRGGEVGVNGFASGLLRPCFSCH